MSSISRKKSTTKSNKPGLKKGKDPLPYSKSREEREKRAASGNKVEPTAERETVYNWSGVHKLEAKDGFQLVYGFSPDVYFDDQYNEVIDKANARKWWERSSAVTQCGNALTDPLLYGTTTCYICGIVINEEAECEHILPVYKASLYLTLYRDEYNAIMKKSKKGEPLTPEEARISKEIQMEYAWSHRCCNQKKGETDFIEYIEPKKAGSKKGKFQLNYKSTKGILESIGYSAVSGGADGSICSILYATQLSKLLKITAQSNKAGIKKKIDQWVQERIDILQAIKKTPSQTEGRVTTIVNYLNNYSQQFNYGMFTLINLCNLISSADMKSVHAIWQNISGNPPIKEIPPVSQITKAIAITELTRDFSLNCKFDWGRNWTRGEMKPTVFRLYDDIFDVPSSISLPNLTGKKDDNSNMSEVIMFSLLAVNKNVPEIGSFYRNFYSVLTYSEPSLFQGDLGKAYASNLVGQAFKITMIGRLLDKIDKFLTLEKLEDTTNINIINFKKQFELLLTSEFDKLKVMTTEYTTRVNIPNLYCDFSRYFEYFLKTVDNLEGNNNIYNIVKPNIDGSGCSVDIPEITQDNINASVVAYYMDESEFLKNIPEWNPDLPDPEDDATTTMLKGVAVGSIGLLSLINNNEHLLNTDDNEDDNEDDNDDDNDDDTASDTAEKEFNEKIRLEKRSELIDLIINISQTSPEMQNKLLDNAYLQDIDGNRMIPEWNPDKVRLLLNSYYNKFLAIIFISLEKQSFMMKLMNHYKLREENGNGDQFVNRLFTYYNLFIETYKDTTRCRGNIAESDFRTNWDSIINCMNINQMAQLLVYIDEMDDDNEMDVENEMDDDKEMDDDNEMDDDVVDASDILTGLNQKKRGRDDRDEMDVADTLTGLRDVRDGEDEVERSNKRQNINIRGGKGKIGHLVKSTKQNEHTITKKRPRKLRKQLKTQKKRHTDKHGGLTRNTKKRQTTVIVKKPKQTRKNV